MKAEPSRQLRLLDLQNLDTSLAQLARQRATLPAAAEVVTLTGEVSAARDEVVLAETAVSDVRSELRRADSDVQLVRDRAARDQARLDAGTGSAKDLQAISHELTSLARRQGELEDIELEVMERAEQAETALASAQDRLAGLEERLASATSDRDAGYAELAERTAAVAAPRDSIVADVGEDLLKLYDRLRESHGGVGAAALRGRRCTGCQLEVNASELAAIRAAAPDEVLRCEECSRILVRTPESGL